MANSRNSRQARGARTARHYFTGTSALRTFRKDYAGWRMLSYQDEPLYSLPKKAIAALARIDGAGSPFLTAADADAERAFSWLCELQSAVGVWKWGLVKGTPLDPTRSLVETLKSMQSPANEIEERKRHEKIAKTVARRACGYLGWLLTESAFLQKLAFLRGCWEELPDDMRPAFPLKRPADDYKARLLACRSGNLRGQFDYFLFNACDQWCLAGLAAWDFPCPQLPTFPDPFCWQVPIAQQNDVILLLPVYYPIQGDDNLAELIQGEQARLAAKRQLDRTAVGLPHWKTYAHMFQVMHLERAIRQRLAGPAPSGLVQRIITATAEHLSITKDQVKLHRKTIASCRNKSRAAVKRLRVKA